jgi:hypothetical protein
MTMTSKIVLAVAIVFSMASASFAGYKSDLPRKGEPLYFKYATGDLSAS